MGVRPAISLAERAGLAVDRGVTVDEYLETSVPGDFAAGDIACWPNRLTGEQSAVEHFVVAERQGQTAARNILGRQERIRRRPVLLDRTIRSWHRPCRARQSMGQSEDARDCAITYLRAGKKLAAVIHRDLEGLRAEVEFERTIATTEAYARLRG